ncbi:MAG: hypothetical protein HFACDABA_00229 [Anaerolineales bacterium]|nr:hypothetical protein [Anaerolineales bacterium]
MKRKLLFPFLALILTLACTVFTGGPDYPAQTIPVSTEAVDSLKQQIEQAVIDGAQSGVIYLFINETQLTSYLAFKLTGSPEPMFTDPQVFLRDGQMRIYGKSKQGMFTANIGIILEVGADEQGKPKLQIVSADFGPLPLPSGLNEAITAIIDEAYTGSLGPVATGLRIETILIADGVMAIVGRIR